MLPSKINEVLSVLEILKKGKHVPLIDTTFKHYMHINKWSERHQMSVKYRFYIYTDYHVIYDLIKIYNFIYIGI